MRLTSRLVLLVWVVGCSPAPAAPDAGADAGGCARDADCDDGLFCNGAERCEAGVCGPASSPPCAAGACDEAVDACEVCDADGDGREAIACGGDDCDDDDPRRFPGNTEVCDVSNVDEDCDPLTYGFRDADSDGAPDARCCNVGPDGTSRCGDDCDDMQPDVGPRTTEVCDGLDNDCDGTIDEDRLQTYYADDDGDGYGLTDVPMSGCAPAAGYAAMGGDCDDGAAAIHPGAADGPPGGCNELDDDCDDTIDEGCECVEPDSRRCGPTDPATGDFIETGACSSGTQICAGGRWASCVGAVAPVPEICGNGLDDDCDGRSDEGCPCVSLTNERRTIAITPLSSGHRSEVVGGLRVTYLSSDDMGGDVEITCQSTGHILDSPAHIPAAGTWATSRYQGDRPFMVLITYVGGNWDALTLEVRVFAY